MGDVPRLLRLRLPPAHTHKRHHARWVPCHDGCPPYSLRRWHAHGPRIPLCAAEEAAFFDLLRTYFPRLIDVKQLMSACEHLKGGLNKLAEDLEVERVGPMHQAGSDSLLTCAAFFKMRDTLFDGRIDDGKYLGVLYGLGTGTVAP